MPQLRLTQDVALAMHEYYTRTGYSTEAVGSKFGFSGFSVRQAFQKYGLPYSRRPRRNTTKPIRVNTAKKQATALESARKIVDSISANGGTVVSVRADIEVRI